MLNYLKKNIPLLGFIVLTVVIALVMTVMDIQKYIGYREAQRLIGVYTEEIRANVAKKPSHNRNNLKAINADKELLDKRIYDAQCRYGKIHRAKLQEFAKAIGTAERDLLNNFKEFHNKLAANEKADTSGNNDRKIFDKFIESLYTVDGKVNAEKKKNVTAAYDTFAKYASDYIQYRDFEYKCFLEALGLPATDTLGNMRALFDSYEYDLAKTIPGFTDVAHGEKFRDELERFYVSPASVDLDKFELAYRQLGIKLDLYKRMSDVSIIKVISLKNIPPVVNSKQNTPGMQMKAETSPLAGKLDGKYMTYTYEIKFTGSMNSIRDFLDNLSNAHKENRIYNVRNVKLERIVESENAENIKKVFEDKESIKFDKEGNLSEAYGRIVIGKDRSVTCELVVDYIMFVDDMIKRTPSADGQK